MAVSTHCPYCAFQCGVRVTVDHGEVGVVGDTSFPVNAGRLCVKGFTAAETLTHGERLTRPLVRDSGGVLREVEWPTALAEVIRRIESVQRRHGREGVGVFGSGALTNEKAYLLGKFARVALGTPNIDYNGRFCMSSGAAASIRAFGLDRGLPFPVEEIAGADVVLLAGGNLAETMPPIARFLEMQRSAGGRLIVVDPRRSATAALATHHLPIRPGTDIALANGLLHLLIREGLIDQRYIEERTEGFARARSAAAGYWPERVERITGIGERALVEIARMLGGAGSVMVLTGRGPEQQSQGVNNALSYINVALALGAVGRPNSGYGCVTGQGNGQGGREHGQKADQLPGYTSIEDPEARERIASVWGVSESALPGPGRSAYEMLSTLGTPQGVRGLLVFGSNPVVSSPAAAEVEERLRSLDFLVVSDFFLSETAALADVVLPSAQWAEEEGTMTNLEGRVIRRRRVLSPPAEVWTDLEILCGLAEALGCSDGFRFDGPEAVFEELRRATAGCPADYSGISYERIDRERGVFWPCPAPDHPGTRRLFEQRFPTRTGKARFHAVHHQPSAEEPDADFPLYLTTGRLLAHYQTGTQTHRVPRLESVSPTPLAEVHPSTARRLGLGEGEEITLTTRRGQGRFGLSLNPGIRRDTVFLPFHWGGAASANRLTNPALDPVSRMPEFKVCAVRIEVDPISGERA